MVRIVLSATLLALFSSGVPAEEPPEREVWEGYLYRDDDHRLKLGWPVVVGSVLAEADHVVVGDLVHALDPFVSRAKGQYAFWWQGIGMQEVDAADRPRVIVRLAGVVSEVDHGAPEMYSPSLCERHMQDARLLSVEFLPERWFDEWAFFFTDAQSPFRMDRDLPKPSPQQRRAFAVRAAEALRAMQHVPGATEEQKALVAKADARARVVERRRRREEMDLLRWLHKEADGPELDVPGLDALGPVAPAPWAIQALFLESPDKAAFLERVKTDWTGSLALLDLPYYVRRGRSTTLTTTDVAYVRDVWTEEAYRRHRRVTAEIADR